MGKTTKSIRKSIKFKKHKSPCYICGKHQGITEWHHAVPVSDVAKDFIQNGESGIFQGDFTHYLFCLCPCCHSYTHQMLKNKIGRFGLLEVGYSMDEIKKFVEVSRNQSQGAK